MPTYKFICNSCHELWHESQPVDIDGPRVSRCKICGESRESIVSGGTGVLLKGRLMNKYIEGYPDFTHNKNKEAYLEGDEMEKQHDAYVAEQLRKEENEL